MFKILIVEDDKELNKTVCSFLNHSGYEATVCLNTSDAYDALYEDMFDLIVSDIMMPGVDGSRRMADMMTNILKLNRLDAGVYSKATTVSLIVGVIGTLIMGIGMSLILTDIGVMLGTALSMIIGISLGIPHL